MVRSTQTRHLSCVKIRTISKLTDPRHLGVPSGASKTISEPMVRLAQTVHLSCTNTNTLQTDRNEVPHDPRHLAVPSGASKMIYEPMVRSAQTVQLSAPTLPTSPRSSIGCIQNDFLAYGTFDPNRAPILRQD